MVSNREDETKASTIDDSLQVLVWPKIMERRKRRRRTLDEQGWVLGWKLPKAQNKFDGGRDSISQGPSGSPIWLCAGILSASQPLAEYERRLLRLRENATVPSSPADRSSSLVESLQILAMWTKRGKTSYSASGGSTRGGDSKGDIRPNTNESVEIDIDLPVITNEKNYPWVSSDSTGNEEIYDDGRRVEASATVKKKNATSRGKDRKRKSADGDPSQRQRQRQLLYYSVYPDNPLAHLSSEFQHDDPSGFSMLLERINHSQEILRLVQTGDIPKERISAKGINDKMKQSGDQEPRSRSRGKKQSYGEADRTQRKDAAEIRANNPANHGHGTFQQLSRSIFSQSLVLQHFHQMTSRSQSSLCAAMPAFRCWSARKEISAAFSSPSTTADHHSKAADEDAAAVVRSNLTTPWKSEHVQEHVAACNLLVSSLLDAILGCLAGIVILALWRWSSSSSSPAGLLHIVAKERILRATHRGVDWLETFPAGFKLNVKLTRNFGYEIRNLLNWHRNLLRATLWNVPFNEDRLFPLLSGIGFCFGWTGLLAVIVDSVRLEAAHALVLAKVFRGLYRAELYLLSSLWRLFRGKKRNPLRARTDSMQYDSTQLLVGTIAFCVCIFLWTTILVYYAFFMVCNLLMQLPIMLFWIMYMTTRSLPLASLWFRLTRKNWFPENVYAQVLLEGDGNFAIARLVGMDRSHGKILRSSLGPHLRQISEWSVNSTLELLKPRSSNRAPCAFPLPALLEVYDHRHQNAKNGTTKHG